MQNWYCLLAFSFFSFVFFFVFLFFLFLFYICFSELLVVFFASLDIVIVWNKLILLPFLILYYARCSLFSYHSCLVFWFNFVLLLLLFSSFVFNFLCEGIMGYIGSSNVFFILRLEVKVMFSSLTDYIFCPLLIASLILSNIFYLLVFHLLLLIFFLYWAFWYYYFME